MMRAMRSVSSSAKPPRDAWSGMDGTGSTVDAAIKWGATGIVGDKGSALPRACESVVAAGEPGPAVARC